MRSERRQRFCGRVVAASSTHFSLSLSKVSIDLLVDKSSTVFLSFSLLSKERKSNKLEVAAPPDLASRTSCETTSPKRWKGKFSWVLQCQIVSCPRVDGASSLFCCRGSDDAGGPQVECAGATGAVQNLIQEGAHRRSFFSHSATQWL